VGTVLSLIGFVAISGGVYVNWGTGWSLIVSGAVLFVAGGLTSAREGR